MFINDIFNDNNKKLDEVSNELLGRYKKAASADATASDKRGDIERGNKRFSGILKATKKQLAHDVAGHKKSAVDEQAPQYTPKGVPLPSKQPAQQQPLNVPQGWEAKTQPDGSTRISKIGSMSSADYKQSMADYKAKNWTPEKMADYSQRMASGQGYSDAERAANYQQQQQHFGQYADQPVDEAGPFSYGARKPRKGSVADLAAKKRREQERGKQPAEPRDQMVGVSRVVKDVAEEESEQESQRRRYPNYYKHKDTGTVFRVQSPDGTSRDITPDNTEEWDDYYRQQFPDLDTPNDGGFWNADNTAALAEQGVAEDWKKVNRRDRTPGMSRKAVKAYRRENPGSKLQTAVTTKPSKLKKGSKSAKRRKSFCARMKGMKRAHAGAKTKRNPDSPINKALRRWNCESIEEMRDLVMIAEQRISAMREGGFDIPEIPRAPQPRPEPKNKTVEDKKLSDQEKQSLRQTVKDIDYTKPPTDTKARLSPEEKKELRQTVKDYEYPKPTNEASAREKLDRRFQELRKKRGAPDPEYYKELGKSYDIENDQERYARQAEIKKKYQVKEARKAEANFDIEDLKRLEQIRDLPTLKAQAMALISKPSERPMKPEKVAWFDAALDRMDNRMAIIKLMYDLLLSGEGHQVIGSKRSMNPNSYRSRFGESTITNEDVEKYVEELERAGYEIVNERRMTCPECGGAAYADEMLAEKQDACYHKVKSRYKVWPSAYASGALVRCRKKGAANWGNKSKK